MAAVDLQTPKASASGPMMTGSRPATQSGYRFGQLSRSSFFARHNPHPHRCIHIKGLLGLPIPVVVDDCDHSSYETHLCFPPNGHNEQKLATQRLLLPVNAINLTGSQRNPLDTINGLQYFTNLRNYSFKEKAVPRLGLVPVTESWREHLRLLTEQTFNPEAMMATGGARPELRREATYPAAAAAAAGSPPGESGSNKPATASRPMYSRQTGRLIPPPSRAMSRKPLRSGHRATPAHFLQQYEHISAGADLESAVFSMLCQILQTEDFNAVQAWLVSSSDREKALVMDVIRSAVANRTAYYEADPTGEPYVQQQQQPPPVNIREDLRLPPIAEANPGESKRVDRLVIEEFGEEVQQPQAADLAEEALLHQQLAQAVPEVKKMSQHQQQPDAKPAAGAKTSKQADDPEQKRKPQAARTSGGGQRQAKKVQDGAKLKYSKNQPTLAQNGKSSNDVWRPQESYAA